MRETPEFLLLLYKHYDDRRKEIAKNKELPQGLRNYHLEWVNEKIKATKTRFLEFSLQDLKTEVPEGICDARTFMF